MILRIGRIIGIYELFYKIGGFFMADMRSDKLFHGGLLFMALIFLLAAAGGCSSAEKRPEKRPRKARAQAAASGGEAARASASDRAPASAFKGAAFPEKSGLDFLSKKLEDTVAGYEEMKSQISSLESRLSQLIALIEDQARKDQGEEIDEGFIDLELSEEAEPSQAAASGQVAASGQGASKRQAAAPRKAASQDKEGAGDEDDDDSAHIRGLSIDPKKAVEE